MDRSVRLSDRVEVAAEMLINAAAEAERLSVEINQPTRVIGWYHSHPQITQYPSIVDLNSQKQYQQMESGWVGLIFSLFHTDANSKGTCYIHCFQTGANDRHVKVPLVICSPVDLGLKTFVGSGQPQMLTVLMREIQSAVSHVRERSDNDLMAMNAALGLQQAQLFTFERLLLEPMAKQLQWCSLPHLKSEVKRLEDELSLRTKTGS
ncbi:BRCA1/BRCA2-containing complex subunit 3 [Strigomonas culicis]|nr:BRCA1/BRCA2-containing complex subunit 3 [Strigomonas culicis]|eukprot:EPY33029.1 BRCA1/BRCA2-containing complex subunit 3 [Strigomonas culicis]